MAEALTVETREWRGSRHARRQRGKGHVPAVLYGHGQETVSLSLPSAELSAALRHGARLVDLKGAVAEKAFIRELQWDTFGLHVLHVDLARVSEDETLRVKVPVELRGSAVGVKEGGVVDHHMHELEIECRATAIPEKIQVNVNELHLNQAITVADLKLPEGVQVLDEADEIVVQCVPPREEVEPGADLGAAEPEIIGRKPEEGEEEES